MNSDLLRIEELPEGGLRFEQVRCPNCNRLVVEAAAGARLRCKCSRCGSLFEVLIGINEHPRARPSGPHDSVSQPTARHGG